MFKEVGPTIIPSTNPTPSAIRRMQKEIEKISTSPTEGIYAAPNEDNILVWDYCLKGAKDTTFEGGYYHGRLLFRPNFPFSPPTIYMITPNGRFEVNTPLCLSISDFHPESWNPAWTISSILIGLLSFMNENSCSEGSIRTNKSKRKKLAQESLKFNLKDESFIKLFPELVREIEKELGIVPSNKSENSGTGTSNDPCCLD